MSGIEEYLDEQGDCHFTEVPAGELTVDPFHLIGKEWMLITAAKPDGSVNTMTAAWAALGWMWEKPVAFIFIRQTRYTKEFIDANDTLSLTFYPPEYKKTLGYLGRVSGRDEDKVAKSGLSLAHASIPNFDQPVPFFTEANLVLLCHKLYEQDVLEECFLDKEIPPTRYADNDYHTCYVVQIDRIFDARDTLRGLLTDAALSPEQSIEQIRSRIDELDSSIVALLNERARYSLAIRSLKPSVGKPLYDPRREEELIEQLQAGNKGPLYNENVRDIYRAVLRVMKELQS